MSAAAQTRIFGVRLGFNPTILIVGLIGLAGLLFWYNSRSDEDAAGASGAVARLDSSTATAPTAVTGTRAQNQRRRVTRDNRGTLKLRAIDPTRGDVDPVLRLDLLERLANVHALSSARNLFESGPGPRVGQAIPVPVRNIEPRPMPVQAGPDHSLPTQMTVNIPLKYYGYAKPLAPGEANRAFFLDGDNIVVALEGQLIDGRYRVTQITPTGATLEDTQVKLSQMLPVIPEALEQGGVSPRSVNQPGMNPNEMNPGMVNQGGFNNQAPDTDQ